MVGNFTRIKRNNVLTLDIRYFEHFVFKMKYDEMNKLLNLTYKLHVIMHNSDSKEFHSWLLGEGADFGGKI